MKRLVVDSGNSRVKWALADGAELGPAHAAAGGSVPPELAEAADTCGAVVIVDVADRVAEGLSRHAAVTRFIATASALGVTNAYDEPSRLGADRWAAVLGARVTVGGACCIVDAGTALTCDVLAADGRHLGGWIAPGLRLAVKALARGTRHVRPEVAYFDVGAPGRDTAGAVAGGAVLAVRGFVSEALARAREALGTIPTLVITGGDAAVLETAFPEAVRDDHLVLRGLAAWAEAS